jgi:hypothetical protein
MKRDELKKGMFITLANGKSFKIYRGLYGTPVIIVDDDILHLAHVVDNDLNPTIEDFKMFIMKVSSAEGEILWERKCSVTMEEIANKFNIPVKQLKITQ